MSPSLRPDIVFSEIQFSPGGAAAAVWAAESAFAIRLKICSLGRRLRREERE